MPPISRRYPWTMAQNVVRDSWHQPAPIDDGLVWTKPSGHIGMTARQVIPIPGVKVVDGLRRSDQPVAEMGRRRRTSAHDHRTGHGLADVGSAGAGQNLNGERDRSSG